MWARFLAPTARPALPQIPSETHIEELVKLPYEAAADPSRWNDFLRLFSEEIHAPSATFLIHDNSHQKANASAVLGIEPAWVKSYEEYFVTINPWVADAHFAAELSHVESKS